jgi:hypothetical protein
VSYRDEPQRLMEDGVYAVVNEADSSSKIMRKGDSVRVVDGRDVHGGLRVLVYSFRRQDRYWLRATRLTQVQGENTA